MSELTNAVLLMTALVLICGGLLIYAWRALVRYVTERVEMEQRIKALEAGKPSYNDIATYEDALAVIIDVQSKIKLYDARLEAARRILGNGRNGEHDRNAPAEPRPEGWDMDVSDSGHKITIRKKG